MQSSQAAPVPAGEEEEVRQSEAGTVGALHCLCGRQVAKPPVQVLCWQWSWQAGLAGGKFGDTEPVVLLGAAVSVEGWVCLVRAGAALGAFAAAGWVSGRRAAWL